MASATGTQGKGDMVAAKPQEGLRGGPVAENLRDMGSPDPKPFNERVGKLLSEFVGKPVTHALVNELTTRLGKQSGVTSVVSEQMANGIKLAVTHVAEGSFHLLLDATAITLLKRKP